MEEYLPGFHPPSALAIAGSGSHVNRTVRNRVSHVPDRITPQGTVISYTSFGSLLLAGEINTRILTPAGWVSSTLHCSTTAHPRLHRAHHTQHWDLRKPLNGLQPRAESCMEAPLPPPVQPPPAGGMDKGNQSVRGGWWVALDSRFVGWAGLLTPFATTTRPDHQIPIIGGVQQTQEKVANWTPI
ncbi:hypothetical protein V497_08055 [Pseudogymnoascus sp. VKM F-4516 (FW-969)]|nr:hypothetical protein V497_08055 [Pseudogymnoascus sp. VKM F-4516 (FW-969)]